MRSFLLGGYLECYEAVPNFRYAISDIVYRCVKVCKCAEPYEFRSNPNCRQRGAAQKMNGHVSLSKSQLFINWRKRDKRKSFLAVFD